MTRAVSDLRQAALTPGFKVPLPEFRCSPFRHRLLLYQKETSLHGLNIKLQMERLAAYLVSFLPVDEG
jgi:hypothetical protein